MAYVGYSSVCNLAMTHPGLAGGVAAKSFTGGSIGNGVAGETVIWLGDGGINEAGYILLEISGTGSPLDYVLEENSDKIKLEIY